MNQTKLGEVAVFRYEFGIKGNDFGLPKFATKVVQLLIGGDVLILHAIEKTDKFRMEEEDALT